MATAKPHVLLLGGMTSYGQAVVNYLAPAGKEPLVAFLRVSDKYLVDPATTYVGSRASQSFKQPHVEYMQANLIYPERVEDVFTPPTGHPPFDIVLDCAGEVRVNRNDDVFYETTGDLVRQCGLQAVKSGVKAYVRITHPYYAWKPEDSQTSESQLVEPADTRGYWWHETLRVLASMPELPLVILRTGATYGPQQMFGSLYSRIVTGRVYQFTEEEMRYLWSPNTKHNSVHTADVARAALTAGLWMMQRTRAEADRIAGETLKHFPLDLEKDGYTENVVKKLLDPATNGDFVAPLFNVVDDGDTTYAKIGDAVSQAFDIKLSFLPESQHAGSVLDMVKDANDSHMEAWDDLIKNSDPPVPNTPVSPFIELYKLEHRPIAMSNDKIKRVLGWKPTRVFDVSAVQEVVDAFIEEGTWPV